MMNNKKIILLVVFVILTVVFAAALGLFLKQGKKTPDTETKNYGTVSFPNSKPLDTKTQQKLKAELPYKTANFEIQYNESLIAVEVAILKTPVKTVAVEAKEWLEKNYVDDICSINVIWNVSEDIQLADQYDPKDTTFCK